MQTNLHPSQQNSLKRKIEVQFAISDFDQQLNQRLVDIAKKSKLPGFRPGKVPLNLIQQRHAEQVRLDIINAEIQQAYRKAITQESLNPAGMGEFSDINVDDPQAIRFTAELEVLPEISLTDFSKIKLIRKVAQVDDEAINDQLEMYRKQHADWTETDQKASTGDKLTIDFEGKLNGLAFDGNQAKDFAVILGEKRLLIDLEKALYNSQAGDTKSVDVRFPKDYAATKLAGETAQFEVTIKTVSTASLPELENPDFLKKMNVDSVNELRQTTEDRLTQQLQQLLDYDNKQTVFDAIIDNHSLLIPEVLISQEIKVLSQQYRQQYNLEDKDQLSTAILNELHDKAVSRVRLGLLIGKITNQMDIQQNPQTLQQQYHETCLRLFGNTQQVSLLKQHENIRREVESLALEKELVNTIYSIAIVNEKPTSFNDLQTETETK